MTLQTHYKGARTEREREIAALGPWFHNLHLPDGTQTAPDHPLGDFPAFKWAQIAPHLPARLDGWSVLDIGCNAGFYTFALAQRGARVTAVDVDEHYLAQARWAAGEFGLCDRIEFRRLGVYDLMELGRTYDLVWFMGVFYHLRYPLLGLDLASSRAERLMVFQSLSVPVEGAGATPDDFKLNERERMLEPGWPRMAFVENALEGDRTNWWVPDSACVAALLRSCGMRIEARPEDEIYICRPRADRPRPEGFPQVFNV